MFDHWKKTGLALTALALATLTGCGEESGQAASSSAAQVNVSQSASTDESAQSSVRTEEKATVQTDATQTRQAASSSESNPPASADKTAQADSTAPVAQTKEAESKPVSLVEKGGQVYAQCAICHGPYGHSGIGKPLAGQSKEELIKKLNLYRSGKKIGVDSSIMTLKARMLTDQDIEAVATYIAARLKER